jgi:citryl-CoA lyase
LEVVVKEWRTKVSVVADNKVLIHGYSHEDIIGGLSFAEGVYLTLRGRLPSKSEARMIEGLLNCALDHGFVAASVLGARYVASGNPQFVAAVAAGLLAAGSNTINPSHSAEFINRAFERMQREGWTREQTAQSIVAEMKANRQRIPGLGHPTHKGADFRAVKLKTIAEECGFYGEKGRLYEAIHAEFQRVSGKHHIPINVDGMMACIMNEMGFDPMEMSAVACMSVLPGVMAHVIEEIREGKPLRYVSPEDSEYTGPPERPLPGNAASTSLPAAARTPASS